MTPVTARPRPYAYHLALAIYLPCLLVADALVANARQQLALGGLTALFLYVATRASPRDERRLVWLAVGFWGAIEVFASRVWGIYGYRFGNVPLFVPFGHGAIYLFGLRAARTPLALARPEALLRLALGAAAVWAVAGLTVIPWLTGRWDVAGASLLPVLAYGLRRSRSATFYASVFFATCALELLGTGLGSWTWANTQPVTLLPSGNPPSVVAAAYCLFDFLLLRVAVRLGIRRPLPVAFGEPLANSSKGIAFS
jgi:hypothetical protein